MYQGEIIKCPHCECKVRISDVENEDGYCPECGQLVMSSNMGSFGLEDDGFDDIDRDDTGDMDGEYDDADSMLDDDTMQADVLDELNMDIELDEFGEAPRAKRGRGRRAKADSDFSPAPSAPRRAKKSSSTKSASSSPSRRSGRK